MGQTKCNQSFKWLGVLFFVLLQSQFSNAAAPEEYQSWSAEAKQAYLWEENILPSQWEELPELKGLGWGGILMSLKSFFSLGVSFDHVSDELPEARTKLLHPYGSEVKFELRTDESSEFTGVLKGATGLARLSLAGDPSKLGYTPGMALKFFIDGHPSVNLHVMEKLDGQGENKNFFQHSFSNILPEPNSTALNLFRRFFELFVDDALHLKVNHLSLRTANGEIESDPVVAHQLFFVPTSDVQFDANTQMDYRAELALIPEGTVLYEVWGTRSPGEEARYIGEIVTTSNFVSSEYGDHSLFFQHNR